MLDNALPYSYAYLQLSASSFVSSLNKEINTWNYKNKDWKDPQGPLKSTQTC